MRPGSGKAAMLVVMVLVILAGAALFFGGFFVTGRRIEGIFAPVTRDVNPPVELSSRRKAVFVVEGGSWEKTVYLQELRESGHSPALVDASGPALATGPDPAPTPSPAPSAASPGAATALEPGVTSGSAPVASKTAAEPVLASVSPALAWVDLEPVKLSGTGLPPDDSVLASGPREAGTVAGYRAVLSAQLYGKVLFHDQRFGGSWWAGEVYRTFDRSHMVAPLVAFNERRYRALLASGAVFPGELGITPLRETLIKLDQIPE